MTTSLRGTGSVLVTVRTMAGPGHSGMYGGAAPDALAALIAVLATLRDDAGDTTVNGLDNTGTWGGAEYPADRFAADAQVLPGVELLGSGSVADTVWARPAATVLAIDAPSVAGVTAAIQHEARAVVNLRVPPGQDAAAAQRLLVAHLEAAAPWGAQVTVEPKTLGQPFAAGTQGRGYAALAAGMRAAYGRDLVDGRPGRGDPAVQRAPGRAPRRRDPADRRGGAGLPHPRRRRERGPRRAGAHRPWRRADAGRVGVVSRSVALALLGVLVLGGCASSGSESAAPSSPSSSPVKTLTMLPAPEKTLSGELTAELQQSSRDVALGRFQVWITNGLQEEIRPRRIVYRDALLTRPGRGRAPARHPVGVLPRLPAGADRAHVRRRGGGRDGDRLLRPMVESVEIPVDDETQVVGRWSKERCAERAIERVAALEWSPGMRIEGSGADAVALFRLTAHPTGRDGSFTIDTVDGHPAVHVGRRRLLDRRREGQRDGTATRRSSCRPSRPAATSTPSARRPAGRRSSST